MTVVPPYIVATLALLLALAGADLGRGDLWRGSAC